MRPMLRRINNLAFGAISFGVGLAAALSDTAANNPFPPVPASPPRVDAPPPDERALPVLQTYCARCHSDQHSLVPERFGSILSLDEIARDPGLVVPGRPDASPLYQRMLAGHAPDDMYDLASGGKGPGPLEIEAVRDWIESLPQPACETDTKASADEAAELTATWRRQPESGDTRFISLLHLAEICEPAAAIAAARDAVARLVSSQASETGPTALHTLGEDSALLALRLGQATLSREQWDTLVDGAPFGPSDTVPADWLADRILLTGLVLDPKIRAMASSLARYWRRNVDKTRAAVELGLPVAALRDCL